MKNLDRRIILEQIIEKSLSRAGKFDFHPEFLAHFEDLKKRLK